METVGIVVLYVLFGGVAVVPPLLLLRLMWMRPKVRHTIDSVCSRGRGVVMCIMLSMLAGCTSRYDAQVAQAQAQQAQASADIVIAQQQAAMFATLADAAKPTYWPIVALCVLAVVALLIVIRWHMVTVAHVASGRALHSDALRLLPSSPAFYGALRGEARRIGATVDVQGDAYYLVRGDERVQVRALIGGGHD